MLFFFFLISNINRFSNYSSKCGLSGISHLIGQICYVLISILYCICVLYMYFLYNTLREETSFLSAFSCLGVNTTDTESKCHKYLLKWNKLTIFFQTLQERTEKQILLLLPVDVNHFNITTKPRKLVLIPQKDFVVSFIVQKENCAFLQREWE